MNTIKSFNVSRPRQEEIFEFHSVALSLLAKCTHPKFMELYHAYNHSFTKFDESLKQNMASSLTKQITLLDHRRDNGYQGLAAMVENALHHFNTRKAAAAEKIHAILSRYGDPRKLPYMQESGVLENILQDLNTADIKAALALIGATDWKDEMQHANDEFRALFIDRTKEQSGFVTGLSTNARIETDNAYRSCVQRLNALAELENDAVFAEIITGINRLIDYQKQVLSARQTRNQAQGISDEELKVEN